MHNYPLIHHKVKASLLSTILSKFIFISGGDQFEELCTVQENALKAMKGL